jgi:hypothetical protein
MAKPFLWLNGGMWNGQQIIRASGDDLSLQMMRRAGGGTDTVGGCRRNDLRYYFATGAEAGITVAPDLNIILVSTVAADFSEIDPLILAALVDMENPLPAFLRGRPAGGGRRDGSPTAAAQPAAPLPDIAGEIPG